MKNYKGQVSYEYSLLVAIFALVIIATIIIITQATSIIDWTLESALFILLVSSILVIFIFEEVSHIRSFSDLLGTLLFWCCAIYLALTIIKVINWHWIWVIVGFFAPIFIFLILSVSIELWNIYKKGRNSQPGEEQEDV